MDEPSPLELADGDAVLWLPEPAAVDLAPQLPDEVDVEPDGVDPASPLLVVSPSLVVDPAPPLPLDSKVDRHRDDPFQPAVETTLAFQSDMERILLLRSLSIPRTQVSFEFR